MNFNPERLEPNTLRAFGESTKAEVVVGDLEPA